VAIYTEYNEGKTATNEGNNKARKIKREKKRNELELIFLKGRKKE
jgi:hypothetical protein